MNAAIMIVSIMINPAFVVGANPALTTNIVEFSSLQSCEAAIGKIKSSYRSSGHLIVDAICTEK
jgi:hypothetical protein